MKPPAPPPPKADRKGPMPTLTKPSGVPLGRKTPYMRAARAAMEGAATPFHLAASRSRVAWAITLPPLASGKAEAPLMWSLWLLV